MQPPCKRRLAEVLALLIAPVAACLTPPANAVRINADGHGQALVFAHYTARSSQGFPGNPTGNPTVTALSVINHSPLAKAMKFRFLEGKNGAEVLDFNLFLSGYDVWTAGVVGAGAGAGIFSLDRSCTSPTLSRNSLAPTLFRNAAYVGDQSGDSLDRTYEGYVEVLEMGTIAAGTPLATSVTHRADASAPNASNPPCVSLPTTATAPAELSKPTAGLSGNASYINVNEGTDVSVDAVAFGQWSDKVQWGEPGNAHPNLSDASPTVSTVFDTRSDGDAMIVSRWNSGHDAVSAVLMTTNIRNDYTVEPAIKAATDWIITMPTKRYHFNGTVASVPFRNLSSNSTVQALDETIYFDREEQTPSPIIDFCCIPPRRLNLSFANTTLVWTISSGSATSGSVLGSRNVANRPLNANWINGWGDVRTLDDLVYALVAPIGQTNVTNMLSGQSTANVKATYYGLPMLGFSAQKYSTTGLPGVNPNVLSNYGGAFAHKIHRRIDLAP